MSNGLALPLFALLLFAVLAGPLALEALYERVTGRKWGGDGPDDGGTR